MKKSNTYRFVKYIYPQIFLGE